MNQQIAATCESISVTASVGILALQVLVRHADDHNVTQITEDLRQVYLAVDRINRLLRDLQIKIDEREIEGAGYKKRKAIGEDDARQIAFICFGQGDDALVEAVTRFIMQISRRLVDEWPPRARLVIEVNPDATGGILSKGD